jgi:hypothetical protein
MSIAVFYSWMNGHCIRFKTLPKAVLLIFLFMKVYKSECVCVYLIQFLQGTQCPLGLDLHVFDDFNRSLVIRTQVVSRPRNRFT